MNHAVPDSSSQKSSETTRSTASSSSYLPPVDEICRILARVLVRVQSQQQTAQGGAS